MCVRFQPLKPIPPQTVEVAKAALGKNNIVMKLRDELGTLSQDSDFAELFSHEGQPGICPWRLAMVCVLQYLDNLSDRGAAEAVRTRIDWKYALSLELTDPGFDFSVLSEFRSRLIAGGLETKLLDKFLERCKQKGFLKARGKQRTDSTHVLAAIRTLNRLELVGETLRATLNAIAVVAPDWLKRIVSPDWFDRYSHRIEEYDLPQGVEARKQYAQTIGSDGMVLLDRIYDDPSSPGWLREIPAVEILRQTWVHQYYLEGGKLRWREAKNLPPAGTRFNSPYDPEARYGNKRSTSWVGYKVHLTETCDEQEVHLITNVQTTPAHVGDGSQMETIHQSLNEKELLPGEHLVDAGYVESALLVSSQATYSVQLNGPVRPNSSWQAQTDEAYELSQFKVDWEQKQVICPQGKKSRIWKPEIDRWGNDGLRVSFGKKDCLACEQRKHCVRSLSLPRTLRLLPQTQHMALYTRREQQQTQEWQKGYNRRAGIEGTISQGVRAFGLRKARYLGLAKVHLQHILMATAINLVRLFAWSSGVPLAGTRISRFAALAAD